MADRGDATDDTDENLSTRNLREVMDQAEQLPIAEKYLPMPGEWPDHLSRIATFPPPSTGSEIEKPGGLIPRSSPDGGHPPVLDTLSATIETAVDALLRRDYAACWRAFRSAHRLDPNHSLVNANLRRLRDLGYDEESDTSASSST